MATPEAVVPAAKLAAFYGTPGKQAVHLLWLTVIG